MNKNLRSGMIALSLLAIMCTGLSAKDKKKGDKIHPDTSKWESLFKDDLSNASFPKGVWTFNKGILTASEDQGLQKLQD